MNNTSNYSGHVHDDDDYFFYDLAMELESHRRLTVASMVVLMVSMTLGTISTGAAAYLLLRLRLWRRHEGYLYLLSLLTGNLLMILVVFLPHWLWLLPERQNLEATSDFTCKVWRFLVNVVYTSGWYLSALLTDAYLRGDHVSPRLRRLASRCCSVTGALTVNGVMTSCFVVINCWTLWRAHVHVTGEDEEGYCSTWVDGEPYLNAYHRWEIASICIMWFVPVFFLVPLLWALVLWSQRGRGRGQGGGGFVVFSGGESSEFPRLALIVGAVVFALQFQMAVIDLWSYMAVDHHVDSYTVYKAGLLVFTAQLVAVPVCCVAGVGEMREGLRAWFRCERCPPSVARAKLVEEINGILALQTIEYPTPPSPNPTPAPTPAPPKTVIRD